MNASNSSAQSSTPRRVPDAVRDASAPADEDDFAIGCECAYPALQIDAWGAEPTAQQVQLLS